MNVISSKIKSALEATPLLVDVLSDHGIEPNWKKFNRTTFELIAHAINKTVSGKISAAPFLVTERMILGEDQLQNFLFEKHLKDEEALVHFIAAMKRPFHWVSGKTLHSYWNGGKAKATKLNVLLVFLGVDLAEWDTWRSPKLGFPAAATQKVGRKSAKNDVLLHYFLGDYYLYYQKSDGSDHLIKAPFTIEKDLHDQITVQTITEGHLYKSSLVELREGILYIHLENQFFNDKENHIFNVGNETNPEVIFGISNTITVKSKLAIGLRNVLIKQKKGFTFPAFEEKELPLSHSEKLETEENLVLHFFRKQKVNQLNSHTTCSLAVLQSMSV